MHIINSNLGEVIKAVCKNKELKQEELAEALGVGLWHIMALENEGKFPSYELLYQLIRFLNIPEDSIFHPEIIAVQWSRSSLFTSFYPAVNESNTLLRKLCAPSLENFENC